MPRKLDTEFLQAALIGLQGKLSEIERQIVELRGRLGSRPAAAPEARKRTMSAGARRRIALAQKKRWAAYKSSAGKPVAAKAKKRVMSAEGRARIAAASKKRWDAFREAQSEPAPPPVVETAPPAA